MASFTEARERGPPRRSCGWSAHTAGWSRSTWSATSTPPTPARHRATCAWLQRSSLSPRLPVESTSSSSTAVDPCRLANGSALHPPPRRAPGKPLSGARSQRPLFGARRWRGQALSGARCLRPLRRARRWRAVGCKRLLASALCHSLRSGLGEKNPPGPLRAIVEQDFVQICVAPCVPRDERRYLRATLGLWERRVGASSGARP
jgi:hypothetical protein